nr:MAG TPA: hypothetical protein [Caudoviricetes sp.]
MVISSRLIIFCFSSELAHELVYFFLSKAFLLPLLLGVLLRGCSCLCIN